LISESVVRSLEASLANEAKISNLEDLDRTEVVVTPVEVNDKVVPAANKGTDRLLGAQGEVKRLRGKRIADKHQIQVTAQVENVREGPKAPKSTKGQSEANSQIKHGGREKKEIIKENHLDEDEEKKIKDLLKVDFSGKESVKDLLEEESIVNIVEEGRRERAKGREKGCGENFRGKLKNHTEVTGKYGKAEGGILEEVKDIQDNMKKNKKKTTENPKEDDENKKKTTDNPKEDNGKKKKTADNPKEDDEKEKTKDEQKNMDQDPVKEVEQNICLKEALPENSSKDPLVEDIDDPNYSSVSFLV
jgi:hypothetical protein